MLSPPVQAPARFPSPFGTKTLEDVVQELGPGPLLILLSAPPGSGKLEWLNQHRDPLASLQIDIVEDFDALEARRRNELIMDIRTGNGRLIVLTHQPAPFDTTYYQRRNRYIELDPDTLALTQDLAVEQLDVSATEETRRSVARILERTNGWRFAWRVLEQELVRGAPLGKLSKEFNGAHPKITRFISDTTLVHLPEELVNALLRLAHFDPIEIDLANHLLDTNQTLALLEEASRRTGFVRREGHAKQFRLHPVFRDVLVDLAEQQIPSDVTALLTRAAKWFETNGDWLAAANAWSQVSSSDRAIAVLAEHADELVTGRGEVASFRAMTRRLPASSTAMLAPEIALGAIFGGDFAGAVSILDDRAIAEDKLTQKQIIRRDALSVVIESGLGSDGRVAAAAHSWLKTHPNAEPRFRAIVAATYFTACHINLDMPGANRALELLEDCLSSTDSPFIAGWFDIFSAMHRIEKGALFAADQILAAAPSSGANKATLQLAKAVVAWETGDARKTQKLIDRHMDEGLRHATIEIALLGLQTAIELKWETSGLEAALEFSREADAWMEGVHGGLGAKALRLFVAAFKLKRGLRTSEQEERQLAHAVESALEHPHASARLKERAKLLLARHATLNDDPRLAISTLQPILRETHQHGRLRPWCQASIIYAGALARKGEQDRAVRMAKKAIATCAELGLHETICSDNLLLAPLAKDLMAAARKQGAGLTGESHFRAVIKELARRTGTISAVDLQDEPGAELAQADVNLTKTELKVLILAAEGASNSQIAERMTVKLSTVKWHMQNVFRKLQAPSRTAAIASGRRLGILS